MKKYILKKLVKHVLSEMTDNLLITEEVGNIRATYIALFRKALHPQDRKHVSKSQAYVDGDNIVFYLYFTYISQGAFDVIGEFVTKYKGSLRIYPYSGPTCCVEITIANRTLSAMQNSLKENEPDNNWKRWINSMVLTVDEKMIEDGVKKMDIGEAYDILKTNFRADSPSRDMFDKACKEALAVLKQQGKLQ